MELYMTLILPYPLAIRAPKLNHTNIIAANSIYQNFLLDIVAISIESDLWWLFYPDIPQVTG
jgi:hypothetical protein